MTAHPQADLPETIKKRCNALWQTWLLSDPRTTSDLRERLESIRQEFVDAIEKVAILPWVKGPGEFEGLTMNRRDNFVKTVCTLDAILGRQHTNLRFKRSTRIKLFPFISEQEASEVTRKTTECTTSDYLNLLIVNHLHSSEIDEAREQLTAIAALVRHQSEWSDLQDDLRDLFRRQQVTVSTVQGESGIMPAIPRFETAPFGEAEYRMYCAQAICVQLDLAGKDATPIVEPLLTIPTEAVLEKLPFQPAKIACL